MVPTLNIQCHGKTEMAAYALGDSVTESLMSHI